LLIFAKPPIGPIVARFCVPSCILQNVCDLMSLTMKNTAILLIGVGVLSLSACSGSFSKVRGAMDQAPEWYADARTEIAGEGYPQLENVPVIALGEEPGRALPQSAQDMRQVNLDFANNPRAKLGEPITPKVNALLTDVYGVFDDLEPAAEKLTLAEAEAIRESFDIPYLTKGKRSGR
jgi:hypothetical protein